MLARILQYLAARLREPSTYPALTLFATAVLHYTVTPQWQAAITAFGIGLAGVIGAALPDRIGTNTRADDTEATQPPKGNAP